MIRSVKYTAAFAAGKTSTVIGVPEDVRAMAVAFPALTAGNLAIEGSIDGTNFFALRGKSGDEDTAYTFTATTGAFILASVIVGGVRSIRFTNSVDQTVTITASFM